MNEVTQPTETKTEGADNTDSSSSACSTKVLTFKMPFQTKHFNKGQRVWVKQTTGALAAQVYGKYRGKHRWVYVWIDWDRKNRECPKFEEFEVDAKFAKRIYSL